MTAPPSISGISSGAYMAVQYQFAYSSEVVGTGVFAGGPFYCAQDLVLDALTACMSVPAMIDLTILEDDAKNFASSGSIDSLDNLAKHNVYIFSGTEDFTVFQGVVRDLEQMYKDLGVTKITTNYNSGAGHSFPTDNFGNPCGTTESPYITNCGIDGAGTALQTIYGKLKPRVAPVTANLKTMSIGNFTPGGASPSSLSMDDTLYYYEPANCNGNCTVHIALAGCQMTYSDIQLSFVNGAGYNAWAEANDIVILYPFTVKSYFLPTNPEGCWDWWGYLDGAYAQKKGPQMVTLNNLVKFFSQKH